MKSQRIASFDFVRLVAILLVIMQHSWTGLQLDEPSVGFGRFFYHALVVTGVPLFFMLSGALLLSAPALPVTDFLNRRFKRLLIPFLLWGTIVYALSVVMHKYPDVSTFTAALYNYVPYMLSDKVNASYWYIFVLMGIYLLTPFMQRALSSSQGKQLTRYGLLLWLLWILLRAYFPQFGSMRYFNSPAFMYIGFFLCGHYCVKYLTYSHTIRLVCLAVFCAAYALNVWGLSIGVSVTLVHTVAVICLFVLLYSSTIPQRLEPFIVSSGRYTYTIYFVHVLVVAMFCMIDMWGWCPLWIRPIAITLLSFAVSYFVAYVFDHTRLVPKAWVGI